MIRVVSEARISVRVQPRARTDTLVELRSGILIVRVTAPPLDGRANSAVCRLLAHALDVRPSCVSVIRGERNRDKVIAVEGIAQPAADAAIAAAISRRSH